MKKSLKLTLLSLGPCSFVSQTPQNVLLFPTNQSKYLWSSYKLGHTRQNINPFAENSVNMSGL